MTEEKIFKNKNINTKNMFGLGFFRCANSICDNLIKTFGCIFIYQSSNSLQFVFYYMLIYAICQCFTTLLLSKFYGKHPKLALILRIIPYLVFFGAFFLPNNPVLFLWVISVTNGITNSCYAAPMAALNGQLKESTSPRLLSIIEIIGNFGSILASVFVGLFLDSMDSKWVALIGIILYTIATLVFYFSYKEVHTNVVSEEELKEYNEINKTHKFNPLNNYYPFIAEGLLGTFAIFEVLWCMYSYLNFNSFATAGFVTAIIKICKILGCYLIGKISKKVNWTYLVITAIIISSSLYLLNVFVINVYLFYICSIILGFIYPFFEIPMSSAFYKNTCYMKNQSQALALKDTYRKACSLPVYALLPIIGSLNPALAVVSIISYLSIIQVKPAYNVLKNYKKS